MLNESAQKSITGDAAVKIVSSIEASIRDGYLRSGDFLPTVRQLAADLDVSPATVSAAYRTLRTRGLIVADGRRGTRVSPHLAAALSRRPSVSLPANIVNLADGNPDPALLPSMAEALGTIDSSPRLYGQPPAHAELIHLMKRELKVEGVIANDIIVLSGAMEAIDRIVAEHLRPGDRVAVEDPGFTGILDLLVSRGLSLVPVEIDQQGMLPDALETALRSGAKALIVTPRVQSPTGAALSIERARELRRVLKNHTDVLIIHDDHARLITDAPLYTLHDPKSSVSRWTYIHSFSKALNPDLRIAIMTGDDSAISRINRRMLVTERWVSHILQRITHNLLADKSVRKQLKNATVIYNKRREAIIAALKRHDIRALGASGFNIWIPVREETATVQGLAEQRYAVSPGERYRLNTPPGIRVTASRLDEQDAPKFAAALGSVLSPDAIAGV